jgi:hypothetical protein
VRSPYQSPTLPPPVIATATPNPDLTPRQRIDSFWADSGSIDCVWLGAAGSLNELVGRSRVVVVGRALGDQLWNGPYPGPLSLITFEVRQVLKGEPIYRNGRFIQIVGGKPPDVSVSDIDQLVMLSDDGRNDGSYFATEAYTSIFAEVDSLVVTPEHAEMKRLYGDELFSPGLDGTSFDRLVERVTAASTDASQFAVLARRGYFAC